MIYYYYNIYVYVLMLRSVSPSILTEPITPSHTIGEKKMAITSRYFTIALAIFVGVHLSVARAVTITSITSPNTVSMTNFNVGVKIDYAGTVTWNASDSDVPQYVHVDWCQGDYDTYSYSLSQNSIGIGDSESANIPTTTATALGFQSASYTDSNKVYHGPVPITTAKVASKTYYYFLVATATMEGNAPIFQFSPTYDSKGWYYCGKPET